MSIIKNEASIKNPLVRKVREQLEHRAMWLALLCDEAEKKGLDPKEFGREAIFSCGQFQGKGLNGGTKSFKMLKKNLFTKPAQWMFEMKVKEVDDDKMSIDFHYCPLVKAWQKMGYSDERIAMLCDTAMCGDRGIASMFDGKLNLNKVIAKGDDICEIRFVKENKDNK
ncbi:MAG: L-2-amino-thiazoline-4-carboxylic acid hydrolase [Clostridia bacterium]